MSTMGEKIRKRREELGWTQDDLAERLGYKTRAAVSHIENDRTNLSAGKVKEIADILGVTPSSLMIDETDYKSSDEYRDYMYTKYQTLFDLVSDATPSELQEIERVVRAILDKPDQNGDK